MAKTLTLAAVITTAFWFSSILISAHAVDRLYVEGKVNGDTCRVEFETKLTEVLSGTMVKLECKASVNDLLTYLVEGKTDSSGIYSLAVEGDREEKVCEVKLVSSPRSDCSEAFKTTNFARVVLRNNIGVVEPKRYANNPGFKSTAALPGCAKLLSDLGFLPLEDNHHRCLFFLTLCFGQLHLYLIS